MSKFVLVGYLVSLSFAAAAETVTFDQNPNTSVTQVKSEPVGIATHYNIIGQGIRTVGTVPGLSLNVSRRITSRFSIGTSIFGGSDNDESSDGNLADSKYYKNKSEQKLAMADLNATFYFRENGIGKWGFLMRAGVGHSWSEINSTWDRYAPYSGGIVDSIFLGAFGLKPGDRQVVESQSVKSTWESTFGRIGGYYQFVWGFKPGNRLAHILEIGVTGVVFDQKKSISNTRPDDRTEELTVDNTSAQADLTYSLAF